MLLMFPPACVQLDQLVIDSAMEKRELEHKHALIQQRVRQKKQPITLTFQLTFKNLCRVTFYCPLLTF